MPGNLEPPLSELLSTLDGMCVAASDWMIWSGIERFGQSVCSDPMRTISLTECGLPETLVSHVVRAKGLQPPQAFAYQDLNLGQSIPSYPIVYQGVHG